jgi:hypothetical protein
MPKTLNQLIRNLTNPMVLVTFVVMLAVGLWVIRQVKPVRVFALGA